MIEMLDEASQLKKRIGAATPASARMTLIGPPSCRGGECAPGGASCGGGESGPAKGARYRNRARHQQAAVRGIPARRFAPEI
jgi:hypothetical protein